MDGKKTIAVIGLGYVGMPLAVEFAKKYSVIGFDTNIEKVNMYKSGIDVTNEVGNDELLRTNLVFTAEEKMLDEASIYIVAVPTPIRRDKAPDLLPVQSASQIVSRHLSRGNLVVYESTVYPGVTEDICAPILEEGSGLKVAQDFGIGYSPERINPGDRIHTLTTITKIVSAINKEWLEEVSKLYESIITAGVFPVSSIKTAEAAKVCENSQRDVNIAFVNELAMAFSRMGIDTNEVIDAMNTKWNALRFRPGLVGGHCIGVDPYYFIYEAEKLGYHSQIISASRLINEGMVSFTVSQIIKAMIKQGIAVAGSNVAVIGLTFKENCPDIRNSKAIEIVKELQTYGVRTMCTDCFADKERTERETGIRIFSFSEIRDCDAIVLAVPHKKYCELPVKNYLELFGKNRGVFADIKGVYRFMEIPENVSYWCL